MSICKEKALQLNIQETSDYEIDSINHRLIIRSYPVVPQNQLTKDWISLAQSHSLDKIWLWCYPHDMTHFLKCGFRFEGILERKDPYKPSVSLAYFIHPQRGDSELLKDEDYLLETVTSKNGCLNLNLSSQFKLQLLSPTDCYSVSSLLGIIFSTYPTPVTNPGYIHKLMNEGCLFAGIFREQDLISMASAYPEEKTRRCEMTDCATLPEFRGQGFTEKILHFLEQEVQKSGDFILYSLARARSFGVNRVFFKLGYNYQGRLVNNCDIAGGLEDMNLWVKN